MGRYLLKDWMVLPISLIYRHLRQWAASFVVSWFFTPHILHKLISLLDDSCFHSNITLRLYYFIMYFVVLFFGCKNLFLVGLKSASMSFSNSSKRLRYFKIATRFKLFLIQQHIEHPTRVMASWVSLFEILAK